MMAASSAEMDLNKVHYLLKRARARGGNRRRAAERDGKSNTWDVYVSPRETSARIKQPESIPADIEFCVTADQENLF